MTQNIGTLVISAIRPNDSADEYSTFIANELEGSLKQVDTYDDLIATPVSRLTPGTLSNLTSNFDSRVNGTFKLNNSLSTWEYIFDDKEYVTVELGSLNVGQEEHIIFLLNTPHIYIVDNVYVKSDGASCSAEIYRKFSIPLEFNIDVTPGVIPATSNDDKNYIDINNYLSLRIKNVTQSGKVSIQVNLKRILPRDETFFDWQPPIIFYDVVTSDWLSSDFYVSTVFISWQPSSYIIVLN